MSKYYEVVDISQKPDKEGEYPVKFVGMPCYDIKEYKESEGGWLTRFPNAMREWLRPLDHPPLSRQQADPSVLVEAFKKFISDYEWLLDKFSEQVSLDIPFVKECLSKKYVAKNALATYKESKPSPSISREQAEKVWEAAATYQQQAIYVNSYGGEIEALDKETYLKQFE